MQIRFPFYSTLHVSVSYLEAVRSVKESQFQLKSCVKFPNVQEKSDNFSNHING